MFAQTSVQCARDSALFDELRAADYPSVSPLRLNTLVLDQAPSVVCSPPFSSFTLHGVHMKLGLVSFRVAGVPHIAV